MTTRYTFFSVNIKNERWWLVKILLLCYNWHLSLNDLGSQIPVITVTDALRESKATAKKQDMLIATEAMKIHEELEELVHIHAFDN